MAAVDMTFIHFYQPPPAVSPRPSLKSPSLSNAGEKRTTIMQCDSLNNLFKTNREIEPTLQSKLAEDIRAGDEESSEMAGNNRGGGDSDINNEEDLCLPFIESFGTSHNLSPEADNNTPLSLKNILQTIFIFKEAESFIKDVKPNALYRGRAYGDNGHTGDLRFSQAQRIHYRFERRQQKHSPEVLNNTGINNRIGKSVIKSTFESSDEQNENSDIIPSRTPCKLLSKQVLAFSGLGGLNSKFETQGERSEDLIVIDDIDENSIDIEDHNPPSLKKHKRTKRATLRPVFKVPPGLGSYYGRALQDHENTASLNWASKISDGSQDNLSLALDKNTKTGDQSNSIETKYTNLTALSRWDELS